MSARMLSTHPPPETRTFSQVRRLLSSAIRHVGFFLECLTRRVEVSPFRRLSNSMWTNTLLDRKDSSFLLLRSARATVYLRLTHTYISQSLPAVAWSMTSSLAAKSVITFHESPANSSENLLLLDDPLLEHPVGSAVEVNARYSCASLVAARSSPTAEHPKRPISRSDSSSIAVLRVIPIRSSRRHALALPGLG